MIDFPDVSNHIPGWKPTGKEPIVGILTSDGHTWKSPTHAHQVAICRTLHIPVLHFHWLRPGNIQAQAEWFVKTAAPQKGDALAVDWEDQTDGTKNASNADKDAFIRAVQKLRPHNRVGLYCNTNYWLNKDDTSFVGDFLWIAEPGVKDVTIQHDWTFWQYKFGTSSPDLNHANFATKAALQAWLNFTPKATAPTATKPAATKPATPTTPATTINPTPDKIRLAYGVKGTMWKSGYHQGDDWHRNAGAAEIGDPIVAVADGTVIYAGDARTDGGQGWGPSFGKHVLIKWDQHGRTSIDAHMNSIVAKTGQHVKAGDLIGHKGMTGNVTGPHDHHEQHLGTRWTDTDVKPIYPSVTAPTPTPAAPAKDDDMGQPFHYADQNKPQKINKANVYQALFYKPGNVTIARGPAYVTGEVHLVVSGLGPDDTLYVRTVAYDYSADGKKSVRRGAGVLNELHGGKGWQWGPSIPFRHQIDSPDKGWASRRLRLEVAASTTNAQIERIDIAGQIN